MKALKQYLPLLLLCVGAFAISCGDDENPGPQGIDCTGVTPSYMNDIKPITDATCALAGCHEANFLNGDFTSYDGLKERVDNGAVNQRVLQDMDMPPAGTTGPTELTDTQIQLIHCWIQDGAPNN